MKKKNTQDLLYKINTKKIAIFKQKNASKFNLYHKKSILMWEKYLYYNGIQYKEISNLKNYSKFDLVIMPQIKSLNTKQKNEIIHMVENGVSVFATGPIGYLDGTGFKNKDGFSEKLFGVTFYSNINPKIYLPSQFKSQNNYSFDILPGTFINWFTTDNAIQALSLNSDSSIYESSYQGKIQFSNNYKVSRAQVKESNAGRVFWTALDPPDMSKYSENEINIVNNFFARTFEWTLKMPSVFIGFWKNGAESVFVSSVSIDDDFNKAIELKKIFKDKNFPLTFFINSDIIKQNSNLIKGMFNSNYELALLGEKVLDFEKKPGLNQFINMQNSRLIYEEYFEKKAYGFQPFENKINLSTLSGVVQNKFLYIFGNVELNGYGPSFLKSCNLIVFPKLFLSDIDVNNKRRLYNSTLQQDALFDEYKNVLLLNGAYFFNLNSKLYLEDKNYQLIKGFLDKISEKRLWKTNFSQLAEWWLDRSNIVSNFIYNEKLDKLILNIKNNNNKDVQDIVFNLDTAENNFDFSKYKSRVEIIKSENNRYWKIKFKNIKSNELIQIF